MEPKVQYRQFCQNEIELPIFFQDWYLDAVCQEGSWEAVILEKKGETVGVLPYYLKRKYFFKYITMPHLCFAMGPYISNAFSTHPDREQWIGELYEKLPKVHFLEQRLPYSSYPIAHKYQTRLRYSYRIPDLENLDQVYSNISSNYRNNKIKKARKMLRIQEDLDLPTFYRINKMSFDRQGIAVPYSYKFLERLDQILVKYRSGKILYAIDAEGNIHSVAYLIWDKRSSYYHIAGDDPALRKSGSGILLIWEAIRFTKEKLGLNIFDFEGSMITGVEKVRKDFGGIKTHYSEVKQYHSNIFKLAQKLITFPHKPAAVPSRAKK